MLSENHFDCRYLSLRAGQNAYKQVQASGELAGFPGIGEQVSPCLGGNIGGRPVVRAGGTFGQLHQGASQRQRPEVVPLRDAGEFGEGFVAATTAECHQDAFGDVQGSTVNGRAR